MNDKLVAVIASAVLGVAFVAGMALHKAQIVTQNVAPQGTPVVVSGGTNGTPNNLTVNVPDREGGDQVFGANPGETTNWISGSFSDDLSVSDELSVTGTSTFSGIVEGVARSSELFMASATTSACSFFNNSTSTRLVSNVSVIDRGTSASVGTISWNVGTSSLAHLINGKSSVSTTITRADSVDIIVPTSTMNDTQANTSMTPVGIIQWRKGEYLNFVASTSVNAGRCVVTEL